MSKRKLNKRQAWRIEKIQQERAARASKKEAKLISEGASLGPEQEGLVIAHYGMQVEIESTGTPALRRRCHFRANLGSLVTGDQVVWRDSQPYGVIEAVLPRHSALSRPDPYGDMKTVAANIDCILIVIAPVPKPHTQLVDRYLVAAENIGITPALVINKTDLISTENASTLEEFVTLYQSLDYEVIKASTKAGEGLAPLKRWLSQRTSVFVGQSGVGKSSLINTLIPNLELQVGAISEANQKGTHTTTTAQLFHFPEGGHLIDSPGIREFGLWHMDDDNLLAGFVEFKPFIGHCKFRDCQHREEPGCAIHQAYRDGHISDYRMESFLALRDSLSR